MAELARLLIVFGLVTLGVGLLLLAGPRIPFLGRLPGDVLIHRDGTTIFLPLASCLVVSLVLTLLVNLFWR